MKLDKLADLNPRQIIIPSLTLENRKYPYWRGFNLGRVALNYAISGGKALSPPLVGPVHLSTIEDIARQAASHESGNSNPTYQISTEHVDMLRKMGYEGSGQFPGIVIGVRPSRAMHRSLNPDQQHNNTQEITLSGIPMIDADPASIDYLHELFN